MGTFCAHTAEMLKHLADRDELIKRPPRQPGAPVTLKSEIYNFHRLDLMRQVGFTVTVYDEDGLKLATTNPCSTPAEAFVEARKIVDNKIESPRKK